MDKKEIKKRSIIANDIIELSNNDAPKLLQLCKDDECFETLQKKFRELGNYYNKARYHLSLSTLNVLEMPNPVSDTSAIIKGKILGGTAGAIISYEKNKEAREKYSKTFSEYSKYNNEYEKNWNLAVKTYNEILDILKSNKKFQLYFAQKKQKQEKEKRNRWLVKERYLFTISLVLSIIISIFVSIIVYNNIKNGDLSKSMNIFFSIIAFLITMFISFAFIAKASNSLFDKTKK